MKGIKMNGVTLYLGNVPGRKSLTFFYHEEGDDYCFICGQKVVAEIWSDLICNRCKERIWKKMTGEE